jgi:CBS domain-containing protein
MNIAFFLTPKRDVVWLPAQATLARAIDTLRAHRHAAVPVLDAGGRYVGTLTEGDILWHLLDAGSTRPLDEGSAGQPALADVLVHALPGRTKNQPVHIDAQIETLVARAIHQNFVPVVDDREVFIGIVRRQSIIEYCAQRAGIMSSQGGS